MKSKRNLMGFGALLIVLFHFWMPLTVSQIETNIYKSTYIGVDIFFFVSAYSLAHGKRSSYLEFIGNRLEYIYFPFIVMSVICAVYKKWTIGRLLMVLCGAEFFSRGGGAFLWFIVAIMLLYLIAPVIIWLKEKFGIKTFIASLAIWLILVVILQYVLGYTTIFIMLNRLPIFMLGMYYDDIRKSVPNKMELPVIILGIIAGGALVYTFGAVARLMKPVWDIYYVVAVPFTISIVGLFEYISCRSNIRNIPLAFIGGITLELYGMQMIFGYDIETKIFKILKNAAIPMWGSKLSSCLLTVLILILIAWVFAKAKKFVIKKIKH